MGDATLSYDAPELLKYGWNEAWDHAFADLADTEWLPARIVRVDRGVVRAISGTGEVSARILPGRASLDGPIEQRPFVGDWCAIEPMDDEYGVLRLILPRNSLLSRKAAGRANAEQGVAANLDKVFLVTDLGADFSVRRVERLLTVAWDSGAEPIIVLNKVDLCETLADAITEIEEVAAGAVIVPLSALHGDGIDKIEAHLAPNQTIALIGSSGVGKSTLINQLLGTDLMETQETRARDGRGQHTTTHRQLVPLPNGALLIDTPGVREIGLWASQEAVDTTFEDVAGLIGHCQFSNCKHDTEPGCAIQAALADGTLSQERYDSYVKLQKELQNAQRRANEHEHRLHERKTWGKIRKQYQKQKRNRDR